MWIGFLFFFSMGVTEVTAGEFVDVNRADAVQLASALDGIGQKKAEKIVAWRKEHGAFSSVDDFAAVPGIGRKLAVRNKDYLQFSSQVSAKNRGFESRSNQEKGVITLPIRAYSGR
jgi:competence protein ComEA